MVTNLAPPYNNLAKDGSAGAVLWTEFISGSDHLPQGVIRAYNNTGAALTAGRPYVLVFDGDEETNPHVIVATASLTGTTALRRVVVALNATASAVFDWFVLEGYCNAMVNGATDVAKDDHLELVPATDATAFVQDASLGVGSVGISCEAQAAATPALTRIYLFNERVAFAAA